LKIRAYGFIVVELNSKRNFQLEFVEFRDVSERWDCYWCL